MTREEAIVIIKEHKIIHKMNEPRAIYISEALDIAIKALEQDLCKDYTWRLMRECPPPEGKDILVCDIAGHVYCTMQNTLNGVHRYYDTGGDKIKNIIAWMPLPEPYKAESEE